MIKIKVLVFEVNKLVEINYFLIEINESTF